MHKRKLDPAQSGDFYPFIHVLDETCRRLGWEWYVERYTETWCKVVAVLTEWDFLRPPPHMSFYYDTADPEQQVTLSVAGNYKADMGELRALKHALRADLRTAGLLGLLGSPVPRHAGKLNRRRGISPEILACCQDAMRLWLDKGLSLSAAADNCKGGPVSVKTVKKWTPRVLDLVDEPTRRRWIHLLRVLGQERHLGHWRDQEQDQDS